MESSLTKNELIEIDGTIVRILAIRDESVLVLDCIRQTMPAWKPVRELEGASPCEEIVLYRRTGMFLEPIEDVEPKKKKEAYQRFAWIAGILPFLEDEKARGNAIRLAARLFQRSEQTVRRTLCAYLAYQSVSVLAPRPRKATHEFTPDERNFRWGLNQFFYSKDRNSLRTAFTLMMKEKYTDTTGTLLPEHPKFHQFKYFYYHKYRNMEKYYISREGRRAYERNRQPMIGGDVSSYAAGVGTAMIDSTVCDLYLINNAGEVVGRPVLTLCVDAFSRLVMGYHLSWEGGAYNIRALFDQVLSHKQQLCLSRGIQIEAGDWNCVGVLPSVLITDRGQEYVGTNLENLCDLGVEIVNLPSYSPQQKSIVERAFGQIQGLYQPFLTDAGAIQADYAERGAPDYRKRAALTLPQFEAILLRCILYYNTSRIIEAYPYTQQMLDEGVAPNPAAIWDWGCRQPGAHLIPVTQRQLQLTMLPRTMGTFNRFGLHVNKLRYRCDGYAERFLKGGNAIVAYNPENVSSVYLLEDGEYVEFQLIESRFSGKTIEEANRMRETQRAINHAAEERNLQARVDLAASITTIVEQARRDGNARIDSIRETRKKERARNHVDLLKEEN